MTDHDTAVRTVADLLREQRLGVLTTLAPDGTLVARPMALQEVEFDGDLWFFAERGSRKLAHVAFEPRVNVAVGSGATWVSVAGTAELVDDVEKKRELWSAGVEAWLPQGPESEEAVLLRVRAESAEYWDAPGGRLATLLSFVRAKARGERLEGQNERLDL
ncbi:pyridoxamine 5'-phosphate oxidase family protein [Cellulomonas sp. C5510]|uniref:pyridoxamine 5'-phosphate oxidase family protein n=1 Tax=Cellulomonas sp. C5510 TaxID=2871170 RepID=UPI001C94D02A|nr:pyridoxamine 5'-phosphate oxidase family protein [Cellulomonas sp. C5510]QZN86086.1 pyridoxamine 5'-phosphate oxidase family protein [Cellulomonas sp. C5510]